MYSIRLLTLTLSTFRNDLFIPETDLYCFKLRYIRINNHDLGCLTIELDPRFIGSSGVADLQTSDYFRGFKFGKIRLHGWKGTSISRYLTFHSHERLIRGGIEYSPEFQLINKAPHRNSLPLSRQQPITSLTPPLPLGTLMFPLPIPPPSLTPPPALPVPDSRSSSNYSD